MAQGRSPLSTSVIILILVILLSGSAVAGEEFFIPQEVFYPRSVVLVWDQTAIWNNPAALSGMVTGDLVIFTSRENRIIRDWGVAANMKLMGAAYRKIKTDPETTEYILAGAYGGRLKIGGSYRYFKDGPGYLNKQHLWTIGFLSRYNQRFSLGLRIENINRSRINGERTEIRYVSGIGGKVYGNLVSAAFDVAINSSESLDRADYHTEVEVNPMPGLYVYGGFDNHYHFNLGFRMNIGTAYVGHRQQIDRNFESSMGTTSIGGIHGKQDSFFNVKKKTLNIALSGNLPENPKIALFHRPPLKFYDYVSGIYRAADDNTISNIFINLGYLDCGLAKVEELGRALKHFRSRGKKVVAYLSGPNNLGYFLASEADHIIVPPVSELPIIGLRAELKTFKGLLDKLGIRAEIERVDEYKTMPEAFILDQPSEAYREQINRILDNLYNQFVSTLAANRNLPVDSIRTLIDNSPLTSIEAEKAGLVDDCMYLDQTREKYAKEGLFSKIVSLENYLYTPECDNRWGPDPQLALIIADGSITGNTVAASVGDRQILEALKKAATDNNIKGVLLRINSPGGSALASDLIWNEVAKIAADKPLVISMGNMAASGGYYIATVNRPIFADRATITGSIGVYAGKIDLSELYNKVGIYSELVTRGKNAGFYEFSQPYTEAQRQKLKEHLQQFYQYFIDKVTGSRFLPRDSVLSLAGGRTWTGNEALANGLIDEIGGYHEALQCLYQECSLDPSSTELVVLPRNTYLFENPFNLSRYIDRIIDVVWKAEDSPALTDYWSATDHIFYRMPFSIKID